jgi:hypothetical protein
MDMTSSREAFLISGMGSMGPSGPSSVRPTPNRPFIAQASAGEVDKLEVLVPSPDYSLSLKRLFSSLQLSVPSFPVGP